MFTIVVPFVVRVVGLLLVVEAATIVLDTARRIRIKALSRP